MVRRVRWHALDRLHGVYVVGFDQFVKIGVSSSIGARLRMLEENLPDQLKVYCVFANATAHQERRLHNMFAKQRVHREWFRLEGALADFLSRGWAQEQNIKPGAPETLYASLAHPAGDLEKILPRLMDAKGALFDKLLKITVRVAKQTRQPVRFYEPGRGFLPDHLHLIPAGAKGWQPGPTSPGDIG